jgi:hypothetical protein
MVAKFANHKANHLGEAESRFDVTLLEWAGVSRVDPDACITAEGSNMARAYGLVCKRLLNIRSCVVPIQRKMTAPGEQ